MGRRACSTGAKTDSIRVLSPEANGIERNVLLKIAAVHTEAFDAYMSGRYQHAAELISRVVALVPEDVPAQVLKKNAEDRLARQNWMKKKKT